MSFARNTGDGGGGAQMLPPPPPRAPLATLDPRTRILGALALMVLSFFVATPVGALIAALFVIALLALGRQRIGRFLLTVLPIIVPLALVASLNLIYTRTGPVIWSWWVFSVTQGGLETSLTYGFRVGLIVCYGAILLATTPAGELAAALSILLSPLRHLGAPVEEWAFVLSLALRFVPTLGQEFQAVREAQASRGGPIARGTPMQRIRSLAALVVPILAAALRHAERLSLALDSRGWESGAPRTRWRPLRLTRADACAFGALILYAVLIIALGSLP